MSRRQLLTAVPTDWISIALIIPAAAAHLQPGGWLLVEVGVSSGGGGHGNVRQKQYFC